MAGGRSGAPEDTVRGVEGEAHIRYRVKVKENVTAKAAGSATLLPTVGEDGETHCLIFICLAPKGLPPHARCLEIPSMPE